MKFILNILIAVEMLICIVLMAFGLYVGVFIHTPESIFYAILFILEGIFGMWFIRRINSIDFSLKGNDSYI